MKIVTSLSPRRVDRQKKCLESWKQLGVPIVAVQSNEEAENISDLYDGVVVVGTDLVGDRFNMPKCVRIKAMSRLAIHESVLIINSDIEIRSDKDVFLKRWEDGEDGELKVGIRWDQMPKSSAAKMFKWGIDAFLITPKIDSDLPDIGMTLGAPAWDYWIPYHLVTKQKYRVTTYKDFSLVHEIHNRQWSDAAYQSGLKIMQEEYGIGRDALSSFILDVTERRPVEQRRRVRR